MQDRQPQGAGGTRRWAQTLGSMAVPLVFCLVWSSAFVATKIGLRSSPPLLLAALRFLLAGAVMLALAAALRQPLRLSARDALLLIALGLLNNALYLGLSFVALASVTAGLVAVLASTNPLFTALLARLALGERLTWSKGLGLALGLGGVAFIMRGRMAGHADDPRGIALALAGVGCFVLGTVLFKRYRPPQSLLVVNGVGVTAGGLALLPVALLAERGRPLVLDAALYGSLAYLALAVSSGGTLLWFHLLRRGSAGAASAYHFLNPGFGLLLGWLVLGEPLSWPDLWGLLPVALGIRLVTRA
jgi:drug/metabolite transporter (DMT)-like permease